MDITDTISSYWIICIVSRDEESFNDWFDRRRSLPHQKNCKQFKMTTWFAIITLLFLFLLWLLTGFFRGPRNNPYHSRWAASDINVALLRQRAEEIEGEIAAGLVDSSNKSDLVEEFGAAVIGDIDQVQSEPEHDSTQISSGAAFGFSLMSVAAALIFYLFWGDPGAEDVRNISALMNEEPDQKVLEDVEERLLNRVADRPDDRDTWIYLAYVLLGQQDYEGASQVFRELERLGSTVELDGLWLIAIFQERGGLLGEEGKKIADRVLAAVPNHLSTLELMVMDAVRSGKNEEALVYLEKILAQRVDKNRREIFEEMLRTIRNKLPSERPGLDVVVDTGLRDDAAQWLIVTARDPESSELIAVVKRPLDERQLYAITIDESVLVDSEASISFIKELVVSARLAVSDLTREGPQDFTQRSKTLSLEEDTEVRFSFPSQLGKAVGGAIAVAVSLVTDIAISPNTPIFVIARATEGSRVPIAVRRLEASQLPTEIRLTDEDSMVKTRSLANFKEVQVVGRAALGGTPVAKSGDFESEAVIVEVGGRTSILIGSVEIP